MREILFRGKRVDNGEWIYGYYIKATHHWHNHGIHEDWIATDTVQNGGWCNVRGKYAVIPGTIGQFTGIVDENGVKVFEGDILACITADFDGSDKFVQYTVTDITNFEQMGFLEFCHKIEVKDNIHRTPQNDEVRG